MAAGAFWLGGLSLAAREAWRKNEQRMLVTALMCSITALGVAGLFGALGVTGALLLVASSAMLASLARPAESTATATPNVPTAWRAGLVFASLAALLGVTELISSNAAERGGLLLEQARASSGEPSREARRNAFLMARRSARLAPQDDLPKRLLAESSLAVASVSDSSAQALLAAEEAARGAVDLNPHRAANYEYLGRVYFGRAATGDAQALSHAEAAFDRSLELAPVNGITMDEYARLELAMARPKQALALARRATLLYPRFFEAQLTVAGTELALGQRDSAVALLGRLTSVADSTTRIQARQMLEALR